jgi:hypothetical protein
MLAEQLVPSRQLTHVPLDIWQNGFPAMPWQLSLTWHAAMHVPPTQIGALDDVHSGEAVHSETSGGSGKPHATSARHTPSEAIGRTVDDLSIGDHLS